MVATGKEITPPVVAYRFALFSTVDPLAVKTVPAPLDVNVALLIVRLPLVSEAVGPVTVSEPPDISMALSLMRLLIVTDPAALVNLMVTFPDTLMTTSSDAPGSVSPDQLNRSFQPVPSPPPSQETVDGDDLISKGESTGDGMIS